MEQVSAIVLVVDDDKFVRTTLAAYLEDEGYEVAQAHSGEEALQAIQGRTVAVAVVDMRLPGMDGNAFIVQAHAQQPAMKFLIHTGSINYVLPEEIIRAGVESRYIFQKPIFEMERLGRAIRDLAGGGQGA